jgi:hypothetical protein
LGVGRWALGVEYQLSTFLFALFGVRRSMSMFGVFFLLAPLQRFNSSTLQRFSSHFFHSMFDVRRSMFDVF